MQLLEGIRASSQKLNCSRPRFCLILLDSETVLLQGQRLLVEHDHPQHSLLDSIIHSNRAVSGLIEAIMGGQVEPSATEEVTRELRASKVAIEEGRAKSYRLEQELSALPKKSDQETRMMEVMRRAFRTYD